MGERRYWTIRLGAQWFGFGTIGGWLTVHKDARHKFETRTRAKHWADIARKWTSAPVTVVCVRRTNKLASWASTLLTGKRR